jgi:hypothetical protein
MYEPKRITEAAVPAAMEKALRYRLLNEPREAESICQDVLQTEPHNQQALITLVLALSDQFELQVSDAFERAQDVIRRLTGDYDREYYGGIVYERWAKAQLDAGLPGDVVFGWIRTAMRCFERAEALADDNDPDAVLRWNTCVRILAQNPHVRPAEGSMTRDVISEYPDESPLSPEAQ